MNEETKKLIEELKGIVLDMYRNAGDLDQWIQQLESYLSDKDIDSTGVRIHVQMVNGYRKTVKHGKGYNSLDAKENSIWERLIIESTREEEQES